MVLNPKRELEDNEKELVIRFFEIKFDQFLLQTLRRKHHQAAYTQNQVKKMSKFYEYDSMLDKKERELIEFVTKHEKLFSSIDLNHFASQIEYKITESKQKELSKMLVDKEYTMQQLFEIMESSLKEKGLM